MRDDVAGRACPRVYRTQGRGDLHELLVAAVEASGGRVLYASSPVRAPIYLGIHGSRGERTGLLIYPFRANQRLIANRPADEHRIQIRLGSENTWSERHDLARDIAHVDTTLVLGVHVDRQVLVGLDPALYDPLPMGISFEFKEEQVRSAHDAGWCVYERDTRPGIRRDPRATEGLETVVLFGPERLLDYARLEREATDLGLDPPLRFVAATAAATVRTNDEPPVGSLHELEQQFDMTSSQILEVINLRTRLSVAVRGGVAEFHLERHLNADPDVAHVEALDLDAQPDFKVLLADGRSVTVECKNVSPTRYANGDFRVEVQKTRATAGNPAGRFYRTNQFDVVAACLYAPTNEWRFVFKMSNALPTHTTYGDRIAPMQRVDATWSPCLGDSLGPSRAR